MRWALAMVICLPLPFIALPIVGSDWVNQQPGSNANQTMMIAIAIGAIALVLGHVSRNQAYKAHWKADVITPTGYLIGNTRFFASVTLGSITLFTLSVLGGWPAPIFAAAPLIIGLLIFNFPNAKPMLPAPPRLLDGERL